MLFGFRIWGIATVAVPANASPTTTHALSATYPLISGTAALIRSPTVFSTKSRIFAKAPRNKSSTASSPLAPQPPPLPAPPFCIPSSDNIGILTPVSGVCVVAKLWAGNLSLAHRSAHKLCALRQMGIWKCNIPICTATAMGR
jgi:hypothetical protein